jgi:hypothetical protein
MMRRRGKPYEPTGPVSEKKNRQTDWVYNGMHKGGMEVKTYLRQW